MSERLTHALDTNIVIALIKEDERVIQRLEKLDLSSIALPVTVLQELYYGVYKGAETRLQDNLAKVRHLRFPVLAFDTEDAYTAGHIQAHLARAGTSIGPNDVQIAAQALARDLTLVTHNQREFARVPGLRVEDWLG